MSGDVYLNIDRIVLHGLDQVDGKLLAASLEQSLLEQLTASPIRDPAGSPRIRTQITLPESFNAEQMGRTLAQSLLGAITGDGPTTEDGRSAKRGGSGDA